MPQVTEGKLWADLFRYTMRPGKQIFVNPVTGNDTTGTGTRANPYLTLSRGIQDVASGQNDIVVLTGGNTQEPPIKVASKNRFAIVGELTGIIPPSIQNPSGRTAVNVHSSISFVNSTTISVTCGAAHGLVVGDMVILSGIAQGTSNRINGPAFVSAVPSTTVFECQPNGINLASGEQPFTGGAVGISIPVALQLMGCRDVMVAGIGFSAPTVNDSLAAMVISGFQSTGAPAFGVVGGNILVTNCFFGNGLLAIHRMTSTQSGSLIFAGDEIRIERNVWRFSNAIASQPNVASAAGPARLYLAGTQTCYVSENFFRYDVFETFNPVAFIRHSLNPTGGIGIIGNFFGIGVPVAKRIVTDESIFVSRLLVSRNFYEGLSDLTSPVPVVHLTTGGLVVEDKWPARAAGTDYMPTQSDMIWEAPFGLARRQFNSLIGSGTLIPFLRSAGQQLMGSSVGHFAVIAGSTASAVQTNAAEANGFYDGALIVVVQRTTGAGAARRVSTYLQSNGTFNLVSPLPFTPVANSDFLLVLPQPASGAVADAVLTEPVTDHQSTANSLARSISLMEDILFGNTVIDRSDPNQWVERHFDRATGLTIVAEYDLVGIDGTPISDANNPFTNPVNRDAAFMRRLRTVGTP